MRTINPATTVFATAAIEVPSNKWINDSLQTTKYTIGHGEEKMWADIIAIGIDTSSSTNNTRSRSRHGSDFFQSESGTDPIIVAEIKGVIKYLSRISEKYDVSNTILQIFTFSNETKLSFECMLENNASLELVFSNLISKMSFDFGSTNLMSFLQHVCEDEILLSKKTHIVIATDGQPTVGGTVTEILAYIDCIPENIYNNLTMALIGAGSIREAPGGGRGILSQGNRSTGSLFDLQDNEESSCKLEDLLSLITDGQSECNISFLLAIMNKMKKSVYLPAYGTFAELEETADKYLQAEMYTAKFYTLLDNGNMVELPPNVQLGLTKYRGVLAFCPANSTWYLYTTQWQVAVIPSQPLEPKEYEVNDRVTIQDYVRVVYKRTPYGFMVNGVNINISRDHVGFWRCRKVLYK